MPGLAEGRPSLLMGDRTIVCEPGMCLCVYSGECVSVY